MNLIDLHVRRTLRRGGRHAATAAAVLLLLLPATAWAAHTFTDVPNSNAFHDDIEWMRSTGVTAGCNPAQGNTKYCPGDPVTREQMAAFMHRLDTRDVFLTPTDKAADADRLDGLNSTAFLRSTAKAADADTLDGVDGSLYRTRFAVFAYNISTLTKLNDVGLASFVRESPGMYVLTWTDSIHNCAWTGAVGARNGAIATNIHTMSINGGSGTGVNRMFVRLENESNVASDESFTVTVNC